jgi:hypothetical protein
VEGLHCGRSPLPLNCADRALHIPILAGWFIHPA